jgi:hypothetical protein
MPPKAVFDVAKAAALNATGMSLTAISRLPGMPSSPAIKRHMLNAGFRPCRGRPKLHEVPRGELLELHHGQNLTAAAIGELYGCSGSSVRRRLMALGLGKGCGKSKKLNGCQSHKWRGGRYVAPTGYVFIHRPSHPNAGPNGYVAEHRLVASESIGRPLRPDEQVHHIDGDKKNNHISNLIVVPRGKHQRLHADIHKELRALRAEVARLRGFDPCNPLVPRYGGIHHCTDWKVVG